MIAINLREAINANHQKYPPPHRTHDMSLTRSLLLANGAAATGRTTMSRAGAVHGAQPKPQDSDW